MTEINLVQSMHASTKRNYVQRVVEHDKAESAEVARKFGTLRPQAAGSPDCSAATVSRSAACSTGT